MSTSISDTAKYRAACLRAATTNFDNFKRDPDYNAILEHVTEEEGQRYYYILAGRMSLLLHHEGFRDNDKQGNPITFPFGMSGYWSPTTLRYMYVLGNLIEHFGSLSGKQILEVGGGYGGQKCTIKSFFRDATCCIVDLDEAEHLQAKYCGSSGPVPTPEIIKSDIIISNYAFSELTRPVQEEYLERFLKHAKHGYITCNFEESAAADGRMTCQEMLAAIPGSVRLPHEPYMGEGLYLWKW